MSQTNPKTRALKPRVPRARTFAEFQLLSAIHFRPFAHGDIRSNVLMLGWPHLYGTHDATTYMIGVVQKLLDFQQFVEVNSM